MLSFLHDLIPEDLSSLEIVSNFQNHLSVSFINIDFVFNGNRGIHNLYFCCHIRLVYGFLSLSRKEASSSSTSSILGRADFKFSGIALLSW